MPGLLPKSNIYAYGESVPIKRMIGASDGLNDLFNTAEDNATNFSKISAWGNWFRGNAPWALIEPTSVSGNRPNGYNYSAVDKWVTPANAAGLNMIMTLGHLIPEWARSGMGGPGGTLDAATNPPASSFYTDWEDYIYYTAKKYMANDVRYFEIWSAPNDAKNWSVGPDVAIYANLLNRAYSKIKQAATELSKTAYVLIGGMNPVVNPPAWSASAAYSVGSQVMSAGTRYTCVNAHTNRIPPNTTYWTVGGNYTPYDFLKSLYIELNTNYSGARPFDHIGHHAIPPYNYATTVLRTGRPDSGAIDWDNNPQLSGFWGVTKELRKVVLTYDAPRQRTVKIVATEAGIPSLSMVPTENSPVPLSEAKQKQLTLQMIDVWFNDFKSFVGPILLYKLRDTNTGGSASDPDNAGLYKTISYEPNSAKSIVASLITNSTKQYVAAAGFSLSTTFISNALALPASVQSTFAVPAPTISASTTPDFTITFAEATKTVTRSANATIVINTTTAVAPAQTVNLAVTGAPSGVTLSLSAASVTSGGSATLTITASATATLGNATITVTGTGASSGTHTATFALTVNDISVPLVSINLPASIPDNAQSGATYSESITSYVSNGIGPYSYYSDNLPNKGIDINVNGTLYNRRALTDADASTFSFNIIVVDSSNPITPTTVVQAASPSKVVTVTKATHGIVAGNYVSLANFTPAGYNGRWLVTAATADTFTFNAANAGLGTVTVMGAYRKAANDSANLTIDAASTAATADLMAASLGIRFGDFTGDDPNTGTWIADATHNTIAVNALSEALRIRQKNGEDVAMICGDGVTPQTIMLWPPNGSNGNLLKNGTDDGSKKGLNKWLIPNVTFKLMPQQPLTGNDGSAKKYFFELHFAPAPMLQFTLNGNGAKQFQIDPDRPNNRAGYESEGMVIRNCGPIKFGKDAAHPFTIKNVRAISGSSNAGADIWSVTTPLQTPTSVTKAAAPSRVVTIVFPAAHNCKVGDLVGLTGFKPAAWNSQVTITSKTTTTITGTFPDKEAQRNVGPVTQMGKWRRGVHVRANECFAAVRQGAGGDRGWVHTETDDGARNGRAALQTDERFTGFVWQQARRLAGTTDDEKHPMSKIIITSKNVRHGIGGQCVGQVQILPGSVIEGANRGFNCEAGEPATADNDLSLIWMIGDPGSSTVGDIVTRDCDMAGLQYNGQSAPAEDEAGVPGGGIDKYMVYGWESFGDGGSGPIHGAFICSGTHPRDLPGNKIQFQDCKIHLTNPNTFASHIGSSNDPTKSNYQLDQYVYLIRCQVVKADADQNIISGSAPGHGAWQVVAS